MCTRFTYNGRDVISGFDFDIDLERWEHRVFYKKDMFYIGIRVRGRFQPIHGVNANGCVSTLLYVPENEGGKYRRSRGCYRIDLLSERVIRGALSFEDAAEMTGCHS